MRVAIPIRRRPTVAERLLGRRRVRRLRRRLGLLAVGTGYVLLKPRTWRAPAAVVMAMVLVTLLVVHVA